MSSAISHLKFPFSLKKDQIEAVDSWLANNFRGTVLYSSGTGKTEISFECARRAALATTVTAASSNNKFQAPRSLTISHSPHDSFKILYLVPRIVLIGQNFKRLLAYNIPREKIGIYFGERKDVREITISTYQSAINNLDLVRHSNMVIFDEVHLISNTAKTYSKIFDIVIEYDDKAILGLTATIDESDVRYNTIMTVLPPIKKYPIINAISDHRLATPIIIPLEVFLTEEEQKLYDSCSTKIRNVSKCLNKYDATSMSFMLKRGGFVSGMAKAWFMNVRKRKAMLSYAKNKLSVTIDIILKKHPSERILIFSETLDSINKLKDILESKGITSKIIDHSVTSLNREKILSQWGKEFYLLLSVHTLEIGYDIPQVRIEIILATSSNMNQAVQRIGRVIRKHEGKNLALIYVVYVSDTKDDNTLDIIKKATSSRIDIGKRIPKQGLELEEVDANGKKIDKCFGRAEKAYNIIESSLYEPVALEQTKEDEKIFRVRSSKEKGKFYYVNLENKSCSCPDFKFRSTKCKHILATEFTSLNSSLSSSTAA